MRYIFTAFLIIIFSSIKAQNADAYYRKAKLQFEQREYEDALKTVNLSLEKNSRYYMSYYLRAQIFYYNSDDTTSAFKDLNRCIELSPTSPEAYFLKALILHEHQNDKAAYPLFEKASKYYPDNGEYLYYQGMAAFNTNDLPNACKCWLKSSELDYDDAKEEFENNCKGVEIPQDEKPKIIDLKQFKKE